MPQETIEVLHDFRELKRQTQSGVKSRFAIDIQAQPIFHSLDNELRMGEAPAIAIRDVLSARIKSIAEDVRASTSRWRRRAEQGYADGEAYAVRRFSGGRTGKTPPINGSDQLFNHSRRLADGLFVREIPAQRVWRVNVPANRLDPSTFRSRGDFERMLAQLQSKVVEIRDPRRLVEDDQVFRTLRQSLLDQIRVAKDANNQKIFALLRELSGLRHSFG